jgi:hypothetical protein
MAEICQVSENIPNWPYVRICRNEATMAIPDEVAEKLDLSVEEGHTVIVCEQHYTALSRFGWL